MPRSGCLRDGGFFLILSIYFQNALAGSGNNVYNKTDEEIDVWNKQRNWIIIGLLLCSSAFW